MKISVVVPLYNEEESLPELHAVIEKVMAEHHFSYEVLLIDDGSKDDSWEVVQKIVTENGNFKGVRFQRNYGKSAALNEGFKIAKGEVIITMDADLQDRPEEIPELYRMITKEGYDIVSGWKKNRNDPMSKTIPSKFFNGVTRSVTGIKLHDFNCGLKAYRKKVIKSIEVYGEMHRYIPVIAKWSGFNKVGEKVVEHHARKHGISKFGMERYIKGFLDLISIMFVGRFGKKPMHFFGTLGTLVFFAGFCIWIYLAVLKFAFDVYRVSSRPIFFVGLLSILVGIQLFLTGFLAELVTRNAVDRNKYLIDEKIGL